MNFRDLAAAARVLRKSPVFALRAALTIALGVGDSAAIFSVTDVVLLRPLPYRDPDRVVVASSDLREGTKAAFSDFAGVFASTPTMIGVGACGPATAMECPITEASPAPEVLVAKNCVDLEACYSYKMRHLSTVNGGFQ